MTKEALQPPVNPHGDQTLADYIKRKEEAFKPVPELVLIDRHSVEHAISALEFSNPYISTVLRSALDKAKKV